MQKTPAYSDKEVSERERLLADEEPESPLKDPQVILKTLDERREAALKRLEEGAVDNGEGVEYQLRQRAALTEDAREASVDLRMELYWQTAYALVKQEAPTVRERLKKIQRVLTNLLQRTLRLRMEIKSQGR